MTPLPAPPDALAAFLIAADGTAAPLADRGTGADTGWQWQHFDLAAPGLGNWLHSQLDPLVVAALMADETRPRSDTLHDGLIVTLRGVNLNPGALPEDMVSIRLWVTRDRIISVRRRRLMAVEALRLEAVDGRAPRTPGAFLARLADGLSRRIEAVSIEYEDQVDALEEKMVGRERISPFDGLHLRQKLIKLRRFVGPQREALEDLATDTTVLDPAETRHLHETANRVARTVEALDAARERLIVLQDHMDAQTAMTLGRNGYILSVMAAIFLPLGFLTGLFGVNVAGMPGMTSGWAFAILCAASAAIGLSLFAFFRWRKWL